MKVLVLDGSPRKNGCVGSLLRETVRGIECEFISVNDLDFAACRGCMACRSKGDCILKKDGAHSVAEKIKEAEILVVGSPCYWGNINGKMKMLFDRLVYVMMGESQLGIPIPLNKGKKCVLVTSGTTPFPLNILAHQTSGVIRELKEIMGYSGFRTIGVIQKGGTKKNPGLNRSDLKNCRAVNRKILRSL